MGSSFTKDSNIDLYMETDKQYYVAGQYVQGTVYLNVKKYRLYTVLMINLIGDQYISWEQGQGEDRRTNQLKYRNYQSAFPIKDFQGHIDQGQYAFPFSFLLPSMMTGSFYYSSSCYLKYTLRAQLRHPSNPKETQLYEMFLNVIQPPRMPIGPASLTNAVQSKCCGCLSNYGIVSVTLKSDKNFVVNGNTLNVTGVIDNSRGKQDITRCKLVLEQHRFMAVPQTQNGPQQDIVDSTYDLNSINNKIHKGSVYQYNFSCKIPQQITNYTAIGRIVARYYVLRMYTQYGCCANKANAALHIIVHSRNPKIVEKKKIQPPSNWNPQLQQPVVFNNMKVYSYSPLNSVPFLNMLANKSVNININDGTTFAPTHGQAYANFDDSYVPPSINGNYGNYQPVYYNQNMFSNQQRQQQGYQPYFANFGDYL